MLRINPAKSIPRFLRSGLLALCLLLVTVVEVFALQVGDTLPTFAQPGLGHGKMLRSDYFHGKVLYLDFWASWCGPCRVSLPAMDALYREFNAEGFEVVAVNVDKITADASRFLEQHPVSYYVVTDDGTLPRRFGVKGMPTAYLIDRKGKVRRVHEGFRPGDDERLRKQIRQLLNEPGGVASQ